MARVLNLIMHIKSLNAKVISLSIEVVPRSASYIYFSQCFNLLYAGENFYTYINKVEF